MNLPKTVTHRYVFRGRVQGVGFRYTTSQLAKSFQLSGSVRNCSDGSVELIVGGAPAVVDQFLAKLQETMRSNIESVESYETDQNTDGDFHIIR